MHKIHGNKPRAEVQAAKAEKAARHAEIRNGKPSRHAEKLAAAAAATAQPAAQGQLQSAQAPVATFEPAKHGAPLPEAVALVAKYAPNEKVKIGRPFERLLQASSVVDQRLTLGTKPAGLAEDMVKNDLRTPLFRMEALLRLYEPKFGKPATRALEKVKALEDQLGAVGLANDLLKLAKDKGFSPRVVAALEKRVGDQMKVLKGLVEKEWTPDPKDHGRVPALKTVVKGLSGEKFGSYEDDRSYLLEQMREHVKGIEEKELDFTNLQEGVHELRRQLRWLPLFMIATDGAVQLDDARNPIPSLMPLLDDPALNGGFSRMPPPTREARPITLSRSLFLANSKAIADIGSFKDAGEYVEFLGEVVHQVGEAKSLEAGKAQAQKLLGGLDASTVTQRTTDLYKDMNEMDLLGTMRRDMKSEA